MPPIADANPGSTAAGEVRVAFAVSSAPQVTLVVVAWRDAPDLLDCLESVAAASDSPPFEVVIVLNEPTAALERTVADAVAGVTLCRTAANRGFGGAVNVGAAAGRGEYLLLLNDDATVHPGWMSALVDAADDASDVGAVGSRILFPDGTLQECGAEIFADGSIANSGRGRAGDDPAFAARRDVDFCSGCSLLIRRSTWDETGGFDEGYFPAYYEDVDLCVRIRSSGSRVIVEPRSAVVHRLSASTSGPYRSYLLELNRRRFVARWAARLAELPAPRRPDGDHLDDDRWSLDRGEPGPVAPSEFEGPADPIVWRVGAGAVQAYRDQVAALGDADLAAMLDLSTVAEGYRRTLEAQILAIHAQLLAKDTHVRGVEQFARRSEEFAQRSEAFAKATEAYAVELKLQVEQLAAEIEEKNVYIREKEQQCVELLNRLNAS